MFLLRASGQRSRSATNTHSTFFFLFLVSGSKLPPGRNLATPASTKKKADYLRSLGSGMCVQTLAYSQRPKQPGWLHCGDLICTERASDATTFAGNADDATAPHARRRLCVQPTCDVEPHLILWQQWRRLPLSLLINSKTRR